MNILPTLFFLALLAPPEVTTLTLSGPAVGERPITLKLTEGPYTISLKGGEKEALKIDLNVPKQAAQLRARIALLEAQLRALRAPRALAEGSPAPTSQPTITMSDRAKRAPASQRPLINLMEDELRPLVELVEEPVRPLINILD